MMKVHLIDNMVANIFGITQFNQAVLNGAVGYRDYAEVEEQLDARRDAVILLDVAFRTIKDDDFETLNTVNVLVSTLVDRYEMDLTFTRNDERQADFEAFVVKNEMKLFDLLRKIVALLKEIHDRQDKDFFKYYHTEELIDLYSYADNMSLLIKECNEICFSMFDMFYDKFKALQMLIEEEMYFLADIENGELSNEQIHAILQNEEQLKMASYLFPEELKLRAIKLQPHFFQQIKFPSVEMMNTLKEVASNLYTRYYPEPLPF